MDEKTVHRPSAQLRAPAAKPPANSGSLIKRPLPCLHLVLEPGDAAGRDLASTRKPTFRHLLIERRLVKGTLSSTCWCFCRGRSPPSLSFSLAHSADKLSSKNIRPRIGLTSVVKPMRLQLTNQPDRHRGLAQVYSDTVSWIRQFIDSSKRRCTNVLQASGSRLFRLMLMETGPPTLPRCKS